MTPFTITTTKAGLTSILTAAGYSTSHISRDGTVSVTINNKGASDIYITGSTITTSKPNAGNGSETGITVASNTSFTVELKNIDAIELSAASTNSSVEILPI